MSHYSHLSQSIEHMLVLVQADGLQGAEGRVAHRTPVLQVSMRLHMLHKRMQFRNQLTAVRCWAFK